MNARAKSLLDEARKLPREDRLELIDLLLADVDIGATDAESVLLHELETRWRAFESGADAGEDAFEAIDTIRAKIASRGTP